MCNIARKFLRNEDGLVTIEWVGIAAVVVLAGIIISSFMLEEANDLGNSTADKMQQADDALQASPAVSATTYGRTGGGS